MNGKQVIAIGKLYRGVMINEEADRFVILDERGRRYEFATRKEAQGFIDAWYAMQFFNGQAVIAAL